MPRVARYRTFCAVGYPESLCEDWIQKLSDTHIPILISPLHEPEEEEKKEHFHIMLDFAGPHPAEDAKEIFDSVGAVILRNKHGQIDHVADKRGMARYFCHLDETEKKKYDISEVTCLSGFDYMYLINLPSDRYAAIGEMIDFVQEYNILSFAQLVIYSRQNKEDWYRSLCDNSAFFMKEFIKSYFWEQNVLAKNESSRNLSLANNTVKDEVDIE